MTIILDMDLKKVALRRAASALLLGFLLYGLFRKGTLLHYWFPFLAAGALADVSFIGDTFFRYYAPDFLWGYALTMMLYVVFSPLKQGMLAVAPFWIGFGVGTVYELLQFVSVFPGTGDIWDVFFYLCAALVAYIEIKFYIKRRKKK